MPHELDDSISLKGSWQHAEQCPGRPQHLAACVVQAREGFLEGIVQLPAGYRTTRRDLLKFLSLGAAAASGYTVLTRAKVMPFRSQSSHELRCLGSAQACICADEVSASFPVTLQLELPLLWQMPACHASGPH